MIPSHMKEKLGKFQASSLRKTGEDLGTSCLEDEKNDDISIKYVYVCVYIYTYIPPGRTVARSFIHFGVSAIFRGLFWGLFRVSLGFLEG
jgi:hypothetical protein